MAHQCPECWSVCYCGGDVDDIVFDGSVYEDRCDHCLNRVFEEIEEMDYGDEDTE